mgnify:CR=1 FL=1
MLREEVLCSTAHDPVQLMREVYTMMLDNKAALDAARRKQEERILRIQDSAEALERQLDEIAERRSATEPA